MKFSEFTISATALLISLIGLLISIRSYFLSKKRRKDNLYLLRIKYYDKVKKVWLKTCNEIPNPINLDVVDLIPLAEEGEFLFGKKIYKHIMSLENKHATHPFFPDEDFSKPFREYLTLR